MISADKQQHAMKYLKYILKKEKPEPCSTSQNFFKASDVQQASDSL